MKCSNCGKRTETLIVCLGCANKVCFNCFSNIFIRCINCTAAAMEIERHNNYLKEIRYYEAPTL